MVTDDVVFWESEEIISGFTFVLRKVNQYILIEFGIRLFVIKLFLWF